MNKIKTALDHQSLRTLIAKADYILSKKQTTNSLIKKTPTNQINNPAHKTTNQINEDTPTPTSKTNNKKFRNSLINIANSILAGSTLEVALELEFYAVDKETRDFLKEYADEQLWVSNKQLTPNYNNIKYENEHNTELQTTITSIFRAANIIQEQEINKMLVSGAINDTGLLKLLVNNKLKREEKEKDRKAKHSRFDDHKSSLEASLNEIYEDILEGHDVFNNKGNNNRV